MSFSTIHGQVTTLVISVISFQIVNKVGAQTYENTKLLRENLLANYHRDIRPLVNQSEKININLTMYLYGILDVDSVKGMNTIV